MLIGTHTTYLDDCTYPTSTGTNKELCEAESVHTFKRDMVSDRARNYKYMSEFLDGTGPGGEK